MYILKGYSVVCLKKAEQTVKSVRLIIVVAILLGC